MSSDASTEEIRSALGKVVGQRSEASWLTSIEPLYRLPSIQRELEASGDDREVALRQGLAHAVRDLASPEYREMLTIVLGLEPGYALLSAKERRALAGERFRGGEHPVTAGTIRTHHEPRALKFLAEALARAVPETDEEPDAGPATVEWNPRVHMEWAAERLQFWKIGTGGHDPAASVAPLREALRRCGCSSWRLHEIFGASDLLLRAWLPRDVEDADSVLADALMESADLVLERFQVSRILRDSSWAEPGEAPRAPTIDVLERGMTRSQLEAMTRPGSAEYQRAAALNLVTRTALDQGFGVAVSIYETRSGISVGQRRAFEEALTRFVDEQRWATGVALYSGLGFASYLLVATGDQFGDLRSALIDPLRGIAEGPGYRTRTDLMATPAPIGAEEELLSFGPPASTTMIEDLLVRGEDATLAFSGAAFTDAHARLFLRSAPRPNPAATESLLRVIAGFLNGEGGTLVIGTLDAARLKRSAEPYDAPQVGDRVVVGVDHEIDGDWDRYVRNLLVRCAADIEPDPLPYLTVTREQVQDRTLCRIEIARPTDGWFYVRSARSVKFMTRSAAGTRELVGAEADRFKYRAAKTRGRR